MTEHLKGSIAGLAATIPMTVTMGLFQRLTHPATRIAPSEVVHRAEELTDLDRKIGENTHEALTGFAHFSFGAAAGATFGLAGPFKSPMLAGMAYGLSVYATSYFGMLPDFGLMPTPQRDRPQRQLATLVSLIVWGAALGGVYGFLTRRKN